MLRLWVAVAAAAALLGVAVPGALAHQGNPNFRPQIRGLTPPLDGIEVQVVNYDDSLELDNHSGKTVIVEGYRGEPYVRIAADGTVAVNHRSTSYYLDDDRYAEGAAKLIPRRAKARRRAMTRRARPPGWPCSPSRWGSEGFCSAGSRWARQAARRRTARGGRPPPGGRRSRQSKSSTSASAVDSTCPALVAPPMA